MELVTPNIGLIFWMVLIFSIVFFILKKYAWKPILKGIKNREKTIEDALNSAENIKLEMAKIKADNEQILAEARIERDKLLKDAREIKDKIIDESKIQAQQEAQKIISAARKNIENEKKAAVKEIKDKIAELSVLVAEKILKERLTEKTDQEKYIEKLMGNINLN